MQTEMPDVREWTILTPAGSMTFAGQLLGRATTEAEHHRGHETQEHAPRGVRCSACRYYSCEVYLIPVQNGERFLVYTRGDTKVPGEDPIPRATWSADARGVLDILVQRQPLSRPDPHDRDTWTWSVPRLSRSARVCLEQAAVFNEDIRSVLAEWNSRATLPSARTA